MNAPLVFLCILLIIGILTAAQVEIPFKFIYVCLILSIIATSLLIQRKSLFLYFLVISCFLLGICVFKNAQILPGNHIFNFTPYKGKQVTVKGVIISEVLEKKNKRSFTLEAQELTMGDTEYNVCGKILVNSFQKLGLNYGDQLILNGTLYRPHAFGIFKNLNYRDFLRQRNIYSILAVGKDKQVVFTGKNFANFFRKTALVFKAKISRIIRHNLSPNAAGLINAMILGKRNEVPQFFNQDLVRTGTVHILAVSGLHVGIIVVISLALLTILGMPYTWRYALVILVLVFYCVLTGLRVSVVRATIMGVILLFGILLRRDYEPYSALSLAAFIILLFCPRQIFDIGFQLSFASVISIFYMAPRILKIFPKGWMNKKQVRFLVMSLSVSLSAWLGAAGIIAYYFNICTPVAVLANMIIVPLLFIVVSCGFLFIILGSLISPLAATLALNCEFFITLIYRINSMLLVLPGAYFKLPDISMLYIFFYYIFIIVMFNIPWLNKKAKWILGRMYFTA